MTDETPKQNPLFAPASRLEVYVLITVAMGSKLIPLIPQIATLLWGW